MDIMNMLLYFKALTHICLESEAQDCGIIFKCTFWGQSTFKSLSGNKSVWFARHCTRAFTPTLDIYTAKTRYLYVQAKKSK